MILKVWAHVDGVEPSEFVVLMLEKQHNDHRRPPRNHRDVGQLSVKPLNRARSHRQDSSMFELVDLETVQQLFLRRIKQSYDTLVVGSQNFVQVVRLVAAINGTTRAD